MFLHSWPGSTNSVLRSETWQSNVLLLQCYDCKNWRQDSSQRILFGFMCSNVLCQVAFLLRITWKSRKCHLKTTSARTNYRVQDQKRSITTEVNNSRYWVFRYVGCISILFKRFYNFFIVCNSKCHIFNNPSINWQFSPLEIADTFSLLYRIILHKTFKQDSPPVWPLDASFLQHNSY